MSEAEGKVVVITGASRGIGAAAALAFARQGSRVFALSRSGAAPPGSPKDIVAMPCDVSDAANVSSSFARVLDSARRIDVLINNAGVVEPMGKIAEVDPGGWSSLMRINLDGPYLCTRAALDGMVKAGSGTIINISSGAAARPLEGWSGYCASKAGLAMLTRCIHEEYASQGIACVGFRPGVVDTGMQAQIRNSGINPVSRIPREALLAPELVAQVLVWLGSGAARERAGTEVNIDDPEVRRGAGILDRAAPA